MATNSVNFFQPGTDAAVEQQQIDRQRKMAELLLQKSQTPAQGQMVSGHYVAPSWLNGVTQVLQGVGSKYANKQADERQVAMGEALRAKNASEIKDFMGALSGTPAQQIKPLTPNDDEGNPMPLAQKDAVAPDRNRALAMAMQSQNPMLQNYGGKLIEQQMAEEAMKADMTAAGIAPPGGAPASLGAAPGAPTGGAPAGGALAGMDPRAVALMLSRSPQLSKLGSTMLEQGKPIALREGDLVVPDGQGGFRSAYTQPKLEAGMQPVRAPGGGLLGASAIPGYAQGIGQIQGAKAGATQGAESDSTLVTVDLPDGPRQMTRTQALQLAGGGTAPTQGMPQAPRQAQPPVAGNLAGPGYAGGSASAAAAGQAEILTAELGKAQQAAALAQQQGDAAGAARAQSDVAGIQRELSRLPGARPASMPGAMPAAGGPGIAVQGEAAKQYDTARAKDFAGRAAEVQKGGMNASNTLRNFDTIEALYKDPNVASGAAAESISNLKSLASSFGVDTKGLGAEQAVQAITNKMALDLRSTADGGGMPGAMSDADRNFLKGLTPDLVKSPEGRALIIDAGRKAAQRQIEVARMATDYERKNGRLDIGFDRMLQDYSAANSLYGNARMPKTSAPAPAAPMDFRAAAAAELARRQKGN